jgi:DNA-binding NtrC family response regulator
MTAATLTALVIDVSPTARAQVTGLLELAGWGVHEAADAEDARWLSAAVRVDLVVTAATVPGAASGPALLAELRAAGSTARFLVVTPEPTAAQRAEALAAGALACLAAPVDTSLLVDLVRRGRAAPAPDGVQDLVDVEDLHDADLDLVLADKLADAYDAADMAIALARLLGEPAPAALVAHDLGARAARLAG